MGVTYFTHRTLHFLHRVVVKITQDKTKQMPDTSENIINVSDNGQFKKLSGETRTGVSTHGSGV